MTACFQKAEVLVTGAGGFIGAQLVRRLHDLGAQVVPVLRPGGDGWRLRSLGLSLPVLECDLSDEDHIAKVLSESQPHYAFHMGAERSVARLRDADTSQASALKGAALLRAIGSSRLKRFVSLGSSLEIPVDGRIDSLHGLAQARETKDMATMASQFGLPHSHARTHYVYGPMQASTKLIPVAIRAARDGTSISLTDQNVRKRLIFVDDLIDGMLDVAAAQEPSTSVTLLSSTQEVANVTIVDRIAKLMGRAVDRTTHAHEARAFDRTHWPLKDAGTFPSGWAAKTSLDKGLQACIDWELRHAL